MEFEKWKIETLIDIAKRGTLTVEGQQNCAKLIKAQQQEIWQAKQERDSQQRCAIKAMTEVEQLKKAVGEWKYEAECHMDEVIASKKENEELKAQAAAMREALKLIAGYSKKKCFAFIKDIAEEALTSDAGKDYHNPADLEALKRAREALVYCKISACRPAQGVAEVAINAIEKALGGSEDEHL